VGRRPRTPRAPAEGAPAGAPPPDVAAQPAGPAAPDPRLIASLDARALRLAQAQKARKRLALDVPTDLYERLISQAEVWDEPLNVVMRAAIIAGLDAIAAFPGDPRRSPFAPGAWQTRRPADIDPQGTQFPPPPVPPAMPYQAAPVTWAAPPTPPPIPAETYVETVWSTPGVFPSGATISPRVPEPPNHLPGFDARPTQPTPPIQPAYTEVGDGIEPQPPPPPSPPAPLAAPAAPFVDPFADDAERVAAALMDAASLTERQAASAPSHQDDDIEDLL
jgi:hypothetical protein